MVVDVRILLDLALILIFAKIFGEIAERLKVDPLVGEIIAGLVVGPILLLVQPSVFLEQIAFIGIIFLMFLLGLSTRFDDVKKDIYSGSTIAATAAILSFIGGLLIGEFVFHNLNIGLFLGVAMMSTSTAIPIKALIDMGEFRTKVGQIFVAISMADDIIAILAVSLLTTYFTLGIVQLWTTAILFFAMIGFIFIVLTFGSKVSDRILSVFQRMRDEQVLITIPLILVFVLAFLSQRVGLAAVTGAFLGGMAMSKSVFNEPIIAPKIKTIGYGFFIPVFFAYSALIVNIHQLISYWWLIVMLLAIGIAAKVIGGSLSGFYGFRGRERNIISIGMIPRGEYAIIVSQLALGVGIITGELYSATIGFVAASIILTPIFMRMFLFKDFRYKK